MGCTDELEDVEPAEVGEDILDRKADEYAMHFECAVAARRAVRAMPSGKCDRGCRPGVMRKSHCK
jgi:hypothetical protein